MKVIINFDNVAEQLEKKPNEILSGWLKAHNWEVETEMNFFPENLTETVLKTEYGSEYCVKVVEKTLTVDLANPKNTTLCLWVKLDRN